MPPAKTRKPGPNATIHRQHRRLLGLNADIARVIDSYKPQYQTGPRHGQQLALIGANDAFIAALRKAG